MVRALLVDRRDLLQTVNRCPPEVGQVTRVLQGYLSACELLFDEPRQLLAGLSLEAANLLRASGFRRA